MIEPESESALESKSYSNESSDLPSLADSYKFDIFKGVNRTQSIKMQYDDSLMMHQQSGLSQLGITDLTFTSNIPSRRLTKRIKFEEQI